MGKQGKMKIKPEKSFRRVNRFSSGFSDTGGNAASERSRLRLVSPQYRCPTIPAVYEYGDGELASTNEHVHREGKGVRYIRLAQATGHRDACKVTFYAIDTNKFQIATPKKAPTPVGCFFYFVSRWRKQCPTSTCHPHFFYFTTPSILWTPPILRTPPPPSPPFLGTHPPLRTHRVRNGKTHVPHVLYCIDLHSDCEYHFQLRVFE